VMSNYYLVWHSAVKGSNAVDAVYATSKEEAEAKANYDGTYLVEAYNANEQSQSLFSKLTSKGLKALKQGEVIRLDEWHLG
jgi:hypothetical protein